MACLQSPWTYLAMAVQAVIAQLHLKPGWLDACLSTLAAKHSNTVFGNTQQLEAIQAHSLGLHTGCRSDNKCHL